MAKLKTEIWVQALIRRAEVAGAYATVARRGDADAGAVIVVAEDQNRVQTVLTQMRDAEGEMIWARPLGAVAQDQQESVRDYIARQCQRDPDLWVVEILDKDGRDFLTEAIG